MLCVRKALAHGPVAETDVARTLAEKGLKNFMLAAVEARRALPSGALVAARVRWRGCYPWCYPWVEIGRRSLR